MEKLCPSSKKRNKKLNDFANKSIRILIFYKKSARIIRTKKSGTIVEIAYLLSALTVWLTMLDMTLYWLIIVQQYL